jgi:hypothetical protein
VRPPSGTTRLLDAATRRGWITDRTAGAIKIGVVPVLVLGVLLWLVVAVLRAGGTGDPPAYAEFVDPAGSSYVDVQLNPSATSYGAFSAIVPGQGRVWPAGKVDARERDGGVVELNYDGVGYQDLAVTPAEAPPGPRPEPQKVLLRLAGQVDPSRHVSSIDLSINGDSHHISSGGQVSGAQAVVDDFLGAVVKRDWDKLYSIEAAYTHNGANRKDFVTGMANDGAVTCIRKAEATGPMTYSTAASVSYARVPIRVTYGSCTSIPRVDTTLVLVVDGGSWKLLSLE